jgi:hypothetical protein
MPVITRSKSKLLASTGPTDGLSTPSFRTTGSNDGLSLQHKNTTGSIDAPLDSSILANNCLPYPSSDSSSSLLVMSSALEFQNFSMDNLNLKFSNTLLCTPSVDTLPDPSLSLTHNSSISNFVTMEEDCEETTMSASRTDLEDFDILFRNFTQQMSTHMNLLQEHLRTTVEQTAEALVHFKQEIREELDELRALVSTNSSPPIQQPVVGSSAPPISNVPASSIPISALDTNLSPHDLQNKMMLMLMESFSKLSTVLVETKTQDVKSEWPKLSGDAKKFRSWYLSIMALISIPPWNEFYDAQRNDVVITTPNTSLNGKLYAKLISVFFISTS